MEKENESEKWESTRCKENEYTRNQKVGDRQEEKSKEKREKVVWRY